MHWFYILPNFHIFSKTWRIFVLMPLRCIFLRWASGTYPTWPLPAYPTTFHSQQLYFQALSLSPALQAAQQDIQKTLFVTFWRTNTLFHWHAKSLLAHCLQSVHPPLQGTFLCSRLRSCFSARLITILHCRTWTARDTDPAPPVNSISECMISLSRGKCQV